MRCDKCKDLLTLQTPLHAECHKFLDFEIHPQAMEELCSGDVGEWRDDELSDDEDDATATDRKMLDNPKILVIRSTGKGTAEESLYHSMTCAIGCHNQKYVHFECDLIGFGFHATDHNHFLATGELTGLLRDPGSKILSFDDLSFFDPGVNNWERMITPVAEWPSEFFS